ncbi:MAG: hypothetical protein E7588_04240 [Ruminococcaceae bacterium]|nr:hypothetical protein [Oscillospiraceae bacterium]
MTDIIFSFDTEDFTSSVAADAVYREAEVLRESGVKGGFCVVGLLADQLVKWGRKDVTDALKYHDIGTHSYGHSLHPTINEYTDLEDFDKAYNEFIRQETEAVGMIKKATDGRVMTVACPPGNQKSYVAMYGYADMGIPVYADTFCDTEDGRGVFYCNIYQVKYTFALEKLLTKNSDEEISEILDFLATKKRAVIFTHPNMANFTEFWDKLNYYKTNIAEYGNWKECNRRPVEDTENFYKNIGRFINRIKNDSRFRITNYSELADEIKNEGERKIEKADIPALRDKLNAEFMPVTQPCSLCISDIFLACRDFLMGEDKHVCGKVYGFLDTPYAVENDVAVDAEDMIKSAYDMNAEQFLPTCITVANQKIGPADWLRAAMAVLCGEKKIILKPAPQLPDLSVLPDLTDDCLKGWVQSDDFKDEYLSKRLKLQAWTMRFMK